MSTKYAAGTQERERKRAMDEKLSKLQELNTKMQEIRRQQNEAEGDLESLRTERQQNLKALQPIVERVRHVWQRYFGEHAYSL